jgi:hypothetical protein
MKTDKKTRPILSYIFNVPGMQKYRILTSFACLIDLPF